MSPFGVKTSSPHKPCFIRVSLKYSEITRFEVDVEFDVVHNPRTPLGPLRSARMLGSKFFSVRFL